MAVFSGNGSAGSPSFTFSSDTNTGLYRVDADKLGLVTNGANALTIDSVQRVGIQNTNPSTPLDVNGDVTITDKIIHSGDTNTSIRFPSTDTFAVETGGIERARVDGSGLLLVGYSGSLSNIGSRPMQVNGYSMAHGVRTLLSAGGGNNTNWVKIYEFSYNATNTTDAGCLSDVRVLVSGSSSNNWASCRLIINRKQQTSGKFYDVKMYENIGTADLTNRVAWKYDATGGTNSAGLLEVWVRPMATFMGVHVYPICTTPLANEFVLTDTGSEVQPAGSILLVANSY